ncbi:MmcQ/YjbR family DNA-binding protein [Paenibacillus pinistramenti]|uniref:MmcQ/YjbR family DNA-binding protein n=1 Tax=Paenibacillus pinistramenti TaxID=1768003 RepID=UPI001107BC05|nr:MmcQ/YjbR family DNA-binding protein [Paenibacillus pinistramenti]
MNHSQLIEYGLSLKGARLQYPFHPDTPVLYVGSKMFALFGSNFGYPSMTLKTNPEEAWIVREQYAGTVLPGYHMNKRHWNTVLLNGKITDRVLLEMIDESYGLVLRKLTVREREAVLNLKRC